MPVAAPPPSSTAPLDAIEQVILVDEQDRPLGISEKIAAHRNGGALHRAFSLFLFDGHGRMLLQQRASAKYHFPLLWTNACCSHPRPGEEIVGAARRRVREELGVDTDPRPAFSFVYSAHDASTGLTEREYDHVLIGRLTAAPRPCPREVEATAWRDPLELLEDVVACASRYTPWFRVALSELDDRGLLSEGALAEALAPNALTDVSRGPAARR